MDTNLELRRDGAATLNTGGLNILIVDDSDVNRAVLESILTGWGAVVHEVRDGSKAVEVVCTSDCSFDFIFMDIFMPVMDGVAATCLIRRYEQEHTPSRAIPVVAYTANLMDESEKLNESVFNAVLFKPSSPKDIWSCVNDWCPARLASLGAKARVWSDEAGSDS